MHKKYVIALYIRLSVEDFKTESLSIRSHNKTKYYQRLYGARDTYFYVQIYHEF